MNTLLDIATRVHNHNYKLDPIFRSMLDQDFYKLLMGQLIWKLHPDVEATFAMKNRTRSVRLAHVIDEAALREQLDHARTVRLTKAERIWLTGNTFYGKAQIFEKGYLDWLSDYRLPEYELRAASDGTYQLTFPGRWLDTTFWEIPALSIVNEMKTRAALADHGRFELDVTYARAKAKLWEKIERLQVLGREGPLKISDFGTRRRHSFLWQRWAVQAMQEGLGDQFTGTSNALLAMENGLEAIGTNAHELPMVYAALTNQHYEALKAAQYDVLRDWADMYDGNLLVFLPDTFGTTQFLKDAPDWVAKWKGFRPDSKEPVAAGEEAITWWKERGEDPTQKLAIFSDGMDVEAIERSVRHFRGKINVAIGWGTNLTNDFRGCSPKSDDRLDPISLVCKVKDAKRAADPKPVHGAVKISDNPEKATGDSDDVRHYLAVFGYAGQDARPVTV